MEVTGLEPIAYRASEAMQALSIGRSLLYEKPASVEIESFHVGTARLIPREHRQVYGAAAPRGTGGQPQCIETGEGGPRALDPKHERGPGTRPGPQVAFHLLLVAIPMSRGSQCRS